MTEWRSIPDWPEYEVSDYGQVRRVLPGIGAVVGRVLKASPDARGYPTVTLGQKNHSVHRLMMAAFVGPSDLLVRHLDDVPTNNVLSNLAYGTGRDNAMDIVYRGAHHYGRRTACARGHEYTAESTGTKISPNGREARVCRTCRAEDREAAGARRRIPGAPCPYGHTYQEASDRRRCADCNRLRQKARRVGLPYREYMTRVAADDLEDRAEAGK